MLIALADFLFGQAGETILLTDKVGIDKVKIRKENALAMANLIYDIFKEQDADKIINGQINADIFKKK